MGVRQADEVNGGKEKVDEVHPYVTTTALQIVGFPSR